MALPRTHGLRTKQNRVWVSSGLGPTQTGEGASFPALPVTSQQETEIHQSGGFTLQEVARASKQVFELFFSKLGSPPSTGLSQLHRPRGPARSWVLSDIQGQGLVSFL